MTDYCCCLLEASVCYLSSNVFCVMETSKLNEDSAAFESKKVQIEFLDREKIILSSHSRALHFSPYLPSPSSS